MKFSRAPHLKLGKLGEATAQNYLRECRMTILAANYRTSAGELDIVALDGATVVFVEVKTLSSRSAIHNPADNLKLSQIKRNIRAAGFYLKDIGGQNLPCRFDFIAVRRSRMQVYELKYFPSYQSSKYLERMLKYV